MSLKGKGTEMETAVDLAALDALLDAATPGEWTPRDFVVVPDMRRQKFDHQSSPLGSFSVEDAALIAALHNAWPAIRRRLEIGDAAVEVCDLTADLRSLWKAMGAGSEGATKAFSQRHRDIDAARAKLRALRETPDA